jgi:Uma2 family endonuclease
MTQVAKKLLSADEFWALPEGEGKRELVRGEVVEEMPGGEHGLVALKIGSKLLNWLESGHGGFAGVEVAFLLAPGLVRLPDVCYVGPEKLSAGIPESYWQTAPDLAIEVISPSETWDKVQGKVEDYLMAGTQMVWTVHSQSRRVVVYTPDSVARSFKEQDVLETPLLAGFSCKVADFFVGLRDGSS